jgi:hypothetical protein
MARAERDKIAAGRIRPRAAKRLHQMANTQQTMLISQKPAKIPRLM